MLLRVCRASLASGLSVIAAVAGAGVFSACSSSPPGASGTGDGGASGSACTVYSPPASFTPSAPVVSFANDIAPIFAASCAFSDCHGSKTAPQGGLYLGADADAAFADLVNVASSALPTMPRIKPGTPADSFLLHKMDGDACTLAGCSSTTCSALMPDGNTVPLAEATRLTVRAWIDQGALSDVPHAGEADAGGPDAGALEGDGGAGPGDASAD